MIRTDFLVVLSKETKSSNDITREDQRVTFAARLINLCRFYTHFYTYTKNKIFVVESEKQILWDKFVDQLANYVIDNNSIESKSELGKLFKTRYDLKLETMKDKKGKIIPCSKKLKERLALFKSLGDFDDGTLSDAEWFDKHGNK